MKQFFFKDFQGCGNPVTVAICGRSSNSMDNPEIYEFTDKKHPELGKAIQFHKDVLSVDGQQKYQSEQCDIICARIDYYILTANK